ncbi:MAG: hypothetical protein LUC49_03215 [Prevotella sp.]|nr:hypothetical protein [Prevotella sp.]
MKKEYISPETKLVLLDSKVLVDWGNGYSDLIVLDKGTDTWEEPEYDEDDGFGW